MRAYAQAILTSCQLPFAISLAMDMRELLGPRPKGDSQPSRKLPDRS